MKQDTIYQADDGYKIKMGHHAVIFSGNGRSTIATIERERPMPQRYLDILAKQGLDPEKFFFAGGTVIRSEARKAWNDAVDAREAAVAADLDKAIAEQGMLALVFGTQQCPGATLSYVARPTQQQLTVTVTDCAKNMLRVLKDISRIPAAVALDWREEHGKGRATHHINGEGAVWLLTENEAESLLEARDAHAGRQQTHSTSEETVEAELADARERARRTGHAVELRSQMVLDVFGENNLTLVDHIMAPDGRIFRISRAMHTRETHTSD